MSRNPKSLGAKPRVFRVQGMGSGVFIALLFIALFLFDVGFKVYCDLHPGEIDRPYTGGTLVVAALFSALFIGYFLRICREIHVFADGSLDFRSPLRRSRMIPGEIRLVKFRPWALVIFYSKGKLLVDDQLEDIRGFVELLTERNPRIQLKNPWWSV